jgi:hypothetical protein
MTSRAIRNIANLAQTWCVTSHYTALTNSMIKAKLLLCTPQVMCWRGGIAPQIVSFGAKQRWVVRVVIVHPGPLYPAQNAHGSHWMCGWMCHSRFGRFGDLQNLFLLPWIQWRFFGFYSTALVTVLTVTAERRFTSTPPYVFVMHTGQLTLCVETCDKRAAGTGGPHGR